MSDFAALEILSSINNLANEIKSINVSTSDLPLWKQPWFGTIVGVGVGFSLNYLKDYFLQGSVRKRKIKCINYEVSDIEKSCFIGMSYCMDFYNEYCEVNAGRITVNIPTDMITKCFENFYSDIVVYLSHSRRDSLTKTYQHLSHLKIIIDKLLKDMADKSLSNDQKEKYIYAMTDSYANIYYSARCFLMNKISGQFEVYEIVKEMGIDSRGLDYFLSRS